MCLSCFGLHLLNAIILMLTGTIIHKNVQLFFALQYVLSILKFTFPTIFQGYVFIFMTLFLSYNQNSVPHLHDISIFIFYLSLSQVADLYWGSIAAGYMETWFGGNQWILQVTKLCTYLYNT